MKIPKVRKLKSGNYTVQLRIRGESISITEPTEALCIKKALEIKDRWNNSLEKELLKDAGKADKVNPTLRQAIDRYIRERNNVLSPSTIRGYRAIQRLYYQKYMDKRIKDIKYQTMVNEEAKDYSPKTIKNSFSLIKAAVAHYYIDLSDIRIPQQIVKEKNWLTPEQIAIFLKLIENQKCELISLFALHSLRRSEILALEKKDITTDTIIVHGSAVYDENYNLIHKETNKNHASYREVPIMIPRLKELTKDLPEGRIFPKDINTMKKQINRICKENNLPQVGIHGLRHSFCSLAYSLGFDEKTTMAVGGWSDFNTMRNIYTHIGKDEIKRSVSKMSNFYKSIKH